MKKSILSLAIFLVAFVSFAQVKYVSPLGNFKVTYKAAPEYQNSDVDTPDGITKLHMFLQVDEAETVFMVDCANYSETYLATEELRETFMVNAVEVFFEELAVTPGNRTNVKSGKYKGLEYKGLSEEYGVYYRVFAAKSTVFQVCILSNNGKYAPEKEVKSFFKSFKITLK